MNKMGKNLEKLAEVGEEHLLTESVNLFKQIKEDVKNFKEEFKKEFGERKIKVYFDKIVNNVIKYKNIFNKIQECNIDNSLTSAYRVHENHVDIYFLLKKYGEMNTNLKIKL